MTESLETLTPDPRNARKHSPENLDLIAASLKELGAARSIVVDENGVILAGNATVEAAKAAGLQHVQVVEADGQTVIAVRRTGLTPAQKRRLALLDNRASELGQWDPGMLRSLAADTDLAGIFGEDDLASLIADAPDVVFPEYDESAEEGVNHVTCPECGHTFPR